MNIWWNILNYWSFPCIVGAIQESTLAISLDAGCANAFKQRANAYYKLNEFEKAEEDVDRGLSLNREWFFLLSSDKFYLILSVSVAVDLELQRMKKQYEQVNLEKIGKLIFRKEDLRNLVFRS